MLPVELLDELTESKVVLPEFRHSLLLVDDEPENLEVLVALLGDAYAVHTAQGGREALDLLATGVDVDLVIADQRMPGMPGVELLSRIAQQSPQMVRIVLTAYGDVEPMLDAINRGLVYRFLVKPYEPEELRAAVAEGLRLKDHSMLLQHLVEHLSDRRRELDATLRTLRDTQDELLAAERMTTLGRATSGIVHDLRNLSMIMSALTSDIRRRSADVAVGDAAEAAFESLRSLIQLLERIGEFARAGEREIVPRQTDVRELVDRSVQLALMAEGAERHRFDVEVDERVPPLQVDADRILQALLALVDNAVRASDPGTPLRVSVRKADASAAADEQLSPSVEWACIEVCDQGIGMDEATLARASVPLFSAFSPPRLGLGLEVARVAVQSHGGCVRLASCPGGGTQARMYLPLRSAS